ncbi:MAG: hypothetical protein JWP29_860, partial [Rhodoferax sp.]|nr:hypothetical protein [Rhodoferax sp.]
QPQPQPQPPSEAHPVQATAGADSAPGMAPEQALLAALQQITLADLLQFVLQRDALRAGHAAQHTTQDGEPRDEIVLTAPRKITLQCGLASITLYANGKIVLRGEYIVSAANGVQRIVGGEIALN